MNETKLFEVLGAVAGIAGISLAALMLLYRDVIKAQFLPTLAPSHAAIIIGLVVLCTFFVAVLGMYAWLSNQGNQWISQKAWIFVIIIALFLGSVLVGAYLLTSSQPPQNPQKSALERGYEEFTSRNFDVAERLFEAARQEAPKDAKSRYWLGRVALERGNVPAAIVWAREGLSRDGNDNASIALLIEGLMRLGGSHMSEARERLNELSKESGAFGAWAKCLLEAKIIDLSIVTIRDFGAQCPVPMTD